MKRTYIIPTSYVNSIKLQSSIMVGSMVNGLMIGGDTGSIGTIPYGD